MLFIMVAIQIINLFLKAEKTRLELLRKDLDNEIDMRDKETYMIKTLNHSQVNALIKKKIDYKYI